MSDAGVSSSDAGVPGGDPVSEPLTAESVPAAPEPQVDAPVSSGDALPVAESDPASSVGVTTTPGAPAGTDVVPVTSPEVVAGQGGQSAPAGATSVAGVNSADGAPAVVDPSYRDVSANVTAAESRRALGELRLDPSATEAERSSGERTLTASGPLPDDPVRVSDMDPVDAEMVGMGPALAYRSADEVRVLAMDRPFVADGVEGGAGDYLAEGSDGRRFVVSQAELDERYRPL